MKTPQVKGAPTAAHRVAQTQHFLLTCMVLRPGSLSDAEVRVGIKEFGIQLNEDDLDLLTAYMQDKGVSGELTLAMFMDLVKASEMVLPDPCKTSPPHLLPPSLYQPDFI
jgi:hypothetical protein